MLPKKERTLLMSPLEQELYLELLGAKKTSLKVEGRPVYQYRDLIFSTDREYESVYCESNIYGQTIYHFEGEEAERYGETLVHDNCLDDYLRNGDDSINLSRHYYGNHIFTVEGLVYAFAKIYHADNVEKYYYETLAEVKKQALLKTLGDLDKSIFASHADDEFLKKFYDGFMRILNISSEEEASEFLKYFIVSTTGVYEKNGYNNALKLYISSPDGNKQYEVRIFSESSYDLYSKLDSKPKSTFGIYRVYDDKPYIVFLSGEPHETFIYDMENNMLKYSCFVDGDESWKQPESLKELKMISDLINRMNKSVAYFNKKLGYKEPEKKLELK